MYMYIHIYIRMCILCIDVYTYMARGSFTLAPSAPTAASCARGSARQGGARARQTARRVNGGKHGASCHSAAAAASIICEVCAADVVLLAGSRKQTAILESCPLKHVPCDDTHVSDDGKDVPPDPVPDLSEPRSRASYCARVACSG